MADGLKRYTDESFGAEVENAPGLTVVDFWAPWCAPCRMLSPVVEQLAAENNGSVNIGKLNVDENPGTAAKFGIRSIPTLLFFRDGKVAEQMAGARAKDEIQKVIDRLA